jgi:hypothetical protein
VIVLSVAQWPRHATPVPGFEHMIIGAGEAGIGMHRDRYCEAGEQLVSTYLAIGRGRKHVVLLPPTADGAAVAEKLGGCGCDDAYGRTGSQRAKLPPRPPPDLLEAVLSAGGYWFDIEAVRADGEAEDGEEAEAVATEQGEAAGATKAGAAESEREEEKGEAVDMTWMSLGANVPEEHGGWRVHGSHASVCCCVLLFSPAGRARGRGTVRGVWLLLCGRRRVLCAERENARHAPRTSGLTFT